jgi:hypothetical protein
MAAKLHGQIHAVTGVQSSILFGHQDAALWGTSVSVERSWLCETTER